MRVAINGFGRIGRTVFRILNEKKNMNVVAINDIADNDAMVYLSYSKGFKPGGSNLTFGFTEAEDVIAERPVAPAMVFPTYESETIEEGNTSSDKSNSIDDNTGQVFSKKNKNESSNSHKKIGELTA